MPGYFNSLMISLMLHALVVLPAATFLLSDKNTPAAAGNGLKVAVVPRQASIAKQHTRASNNHPGQTQKPLETQPTPPVEISTTREAQEKTAQPAPTRHTTISKSTVQAKPAVKTATKKPVQTATKQPKTKAKTPPRLPDPPKTQSAQLEKPPAVAKNTLNPQTTEKRLRPDTALSPLDNTHSHLENDYRNRLLAAIVAAQHYPRRARRRGIEGEVTVSFNLLKDGRITDIQIERQSDHGILNHAALETLRRTGRVEPIPEELARNHWEFKIPIKFQLH